MEKDTLAVITELNQIYRRLEDKGLQIVTGMNWMFEPKLGYYSGHFRRQGDGRMVVDTYPIPVVEVKGYCDVEINLDCIIISTKLCRTDALIYSYDKFTRFEFEYGLDDYACGFYQFGMTISELKDKIRNSNQEEIAFFFKFDFDVDNSTIFDFIKLLRRDGFYR